ncbi:hypothetical protein [[Limnothrix rosea] IAM M-220]|uniref:hypothetical protein n=1 Tax=[Limnothrix rosea] IAM M-220 TaxID=454133 RepID=UPI0015C536D6|nr:hypothetical protein [[Limnothrix rosea] IAM M-220]
MVANGYGEFGRSPLSSLTGKSWLKIMVQNNNLHQALSMNILFLRRAAREILLVRLKP